MAGSPIRRARREAAARAAGVDPAMTSSVEMNPARAADVQAGLDQVAYQASRPGDCTSTSPQDAPIPAHARTSDHRAQLMQVANQCLAQLLVSPNRDVSYAYKDAMYLLMKLEAQDKDPTPRPEDVRRGVVDMLAMLPDLCANDDELRTLAVEALARVVEQAEG